MDKYRKKFGNMLKEQRRLMQLTLYQLAAASGVSPSHLSRIEKGDRYPSADVLKRIAKPLGFEERELFTLAGYLSPRPASIAEKEPGYSGKQLDPYVAKVLAQEPVEVQKALVSMLGIIKKIAPRPTTTQKHS